MTPPREQPRPTCPKCGKRPVMPRTTTQGMSPRQCGACCRAQKGNWVRSVKRWGEVWGEDVARETCREQGVPPQGLGAAASATASATPATGATTGPTLVVSRIAPVSAAPATGAGATEGESEEYVAIDVHDAGGDRQVVAQKRGITVAEVERIAERYSRLAAGDPRGVGVLSYSVLARALLRLRDEIGDLTTGALSQTVGALQRLHSELGEGATSVTKLELHFAGGDEPLVIKPGEEEEEATEDLH